MAKNYLQIVALFIFLLVFSLSNSQIPDAKSSNHIEGLSIYPNPAGNGKLYITTKNKLIKKIEIFDVLGKQVLSSTIMGKALDISILNPGVYVIKIEEEQDIETRKLVVR